MVAAYDMRETIMQTNKAWPSFIFPSPGTKQATDRVVHLRNDNASSFPLLDVLVSWMEAMSQWWGWESRTDVGLVDAVSRNYLDKARPCIPISSNLVLSSWPPSQLVYSKIDI